MHIRVSAPDDHLSQAEIDDIERDLAKIDRRLADFKDEVRAEVRISNNNAGAKSRHVVIELHYGRTHLRAKVDHTDVGQAVRAAREDLLRQINDRKRGGHSSFSKH